MWEISIEHQQVSIVVSFFCKTIYHGHPSYYHRPPSIWSHSILLSGAHGIISRGIVFFPPQQCSHNISYWYLSKMFHVFVAVDCISRLVLVLTGSWMYTNTGKCCRVSRCAGVSLPISSLFLFLVSSSLLVSSVSTSPML